MTIHLNLVNVPAENTATDVMWKCTVCWSKVGFNREGIGEPFASETSYPENIDDYMGAVCLPAPIQAPKELFYAFMQDAEINAIQDSVDSTVRAAAFRFKEAGSIPVNHPYVINSLYYLESIGLINAGRGDEILAAVTAQL